MSLALAAVYAAPQSEHQLPMPAIMFGLIALAVFAVLGVVMWSFRDVANRHAQVSGRPGGDGHGTGGPHGD